MKLRPVNFIKYLTGFSAEALKVAIKMIRSKKGNFIA